MKKIMALVLAAMMLLACCSALAEAPEGYPEVKEGIDFGGADVTIYDYWSGEGARKEDPTEEEALSFSPPGWFLKDVTFDPAWHNAAMAYKIPQDI